MKRLQQIDELSLADHRFINKDDDCYFIMSYTSGKRYDYSEENSLISNLKKAMDKKDKPDWRYKERAINICANYLKEVNISSLFSEDFTLVPITPSKAKDDPEYDDRLSQILHEAFGDELDVREIIIQKESTISAHSTDAKRNPDKIEENYLIDENQTQNVKNCIVLFDDVLTSGAHFKAAESLLLKRFPNKSIKGLFIARRVFEQQDDTSKPDIFKLNLKLSKPD